MHLDTCTIGLFAFTDYLEMFELFINLAKLVSSVTAYDRTNCRHRGLRYRKMTIHEVV